LPESVRSLPNSYLHLSDIHFLVQHGDGQTGSEGNRHGLGAFPGENRVCCIVEGSPLDVVKMTQQHMPYVGLKVHPVAPVSDLHELLKHMDG